MPPKDRRTVDRNVFGPTREGNGRTAYGGNMPTYRTAYTAAQRAALFELAESSPTPEEYAVRRAEILSVPNPPPQKK